MASPAISVLLPVFNGGKYLGVTLASILAQTFSDFEVIAIDDGSTDDSLSLLERAAERDDRIQITSRPNQGLVATLNEGLDRAQGRFIARLDADDVAYPNRLETQLAMFGAIPGLGMCGSGFDILFESRRTIQTLDPLYRDGDLSIMARLYTIFIHSTVMYDRDVLGPDILFYDEDYPHAEDFDLFRRIAARFRVATVLDSLISYRLHEESVSSRMRVEMRRTHAKIVQEELSDSGIDDLGAMEAILDTVDLPTVARLCRFFVRLERWIEEQPDERRPSWRFGFVQLFYVFYTHVRDEGGPLHLQRFVLDSGQPKLLKRRDRLAVDLQTVPALGAFAHMTIERLNTFERHLRSHPVAFDELTVK